MIAKPETECIRCGNTIRENENYCRECSAPRPKVSENRCSNPQCGIILEANDKYCGVCQSPSTMWKKSHEFMN